MLIQLRRLAIVVLAIFCSSRLAHSGEDLARGAAVLQQTSTTTEAEFKQSLRQFGKLTVHVASKSVEGTYSHTSDGALARDEVSCLGTPKSVYVAVPRKRFNAQQATTTLSQSMRRSTLHDRSVGFNSKR